MNSGPVSIRRLTKILKIPAAQKCDRHLLRDALSSAKPLSYLMSATDCVLLCVLDWMVGAKP